jgi:hypothetical protein
VQKSGGDVPSDATIAKHADPAERRIGHCRFLR